MRRILGGLTVLVTVGACALGLWAGVGRAAGPMPAVPERDALGSPVVLAAEAATAPLAEPVADVATDAVDIVVPAPTLVADPVATPVAPQPVDDVPPAPAEEPPARTDEPAGRVEAAAAPQRSAVVSCAVGPEGAFVAVDFVADCPGSAALVVEATTDA